VGAIDVVKVWHLQRHVVQAGRVTLSECQNVVVGTIGTKEHLATESIDRFEAPAVVVELSLRTDAFRL
jgi:hypothetical protein